MRVERSLARWLETTTLTVPSLCSSSSSSSSSSSLEDARGGVARALFLDARDAEAFSRARLRFSANVPLDAIDRGDAGCALPPRTQPFVLIADPNVDVEAQIARFVVDFKGVPWRLDACFVGDDAFFDACEAVNDARVGVARGEDNGGCTPRERLRLWSPSPEFAAWLPKVERETLGAASVGASNDAATCVDLGCGAGRDCVWAASRGWRVIAIDNDKKGLARCEALAEQHGVRERVTTLEMDLTKLSAEDVFARVSSALASSSSSSSSSVVVVYAVRYLHKPLMRALASRAAFATAVVWVHFMRGCETTDVGRPSKAKDLLEPGELRAAFEGWDIVVDAVALLPDGRPVSEFVAIRRQS